MPEQFLDDVTILGYASELSLAPGEQLKLHLSASRPTAARVEVVRLDADAPTLATADVNLGPQPLDRGDCFDIDLPDSWLTTDQDVVMWAFVMPTRPDQSDQVVLGGWQDEQGGIALAISRGCAELWVQGAEKRHVVRAEQGVRPWAWYLLVGVVGDGRLRLHQRPVVNPYNQRLAPYLDWDEAQDAALELVAPIGLRPAPFRLGAAGGPDGHPTHHFDGKIDLAGLAHATVTDTAVAELLATGSWGAGKVIAAWDPAAGMDSSGINDVLIDRGPGGHHGKARNKPTRLVTGRLWAGRDDTFELDAAQYSAVAYASDSLTDCRWDLTTAITIPAETPSGVYAARIRSAGHVEEIPFVVRASAPRHDLLVVLPTMTYVAESDDRLTQLKLAVSTPIASPKDASGSDVGGSTGDVHPDGTGVCFASRRRPLKELRSDARSTFMPGPGTFAIDLDLLRFLHHSGTAFDLITDDDLHRDGAAALRPYRAVSTASRPVYATEAVLKGYDDYVAGGGRLICPGGGAFYWVTSVDPADPAVLEVRRGENGMRAWQIGPGELYHATTGERGGLWRGRGRPPQRLLGTGYAARGFGPGSAFKRMPDSFHRAVSWIFDGIQGDIFGERSRLPGGAAGLEIDRYDRSLGSPPHARILASSTRLSDDYHQAIEETLFTLAGRGGRENEHVRADMVFFTTPHGGAVFAAGSAAWCAALAVDNFDNTVARVTANVLRGMLTPRLPGTRFDDEDDLEGAPGAVRSALAGAFTRRRHSAGKP